MMSSMQKKALFPALLGVSAVAVGATLSPDTSIRNEQPMGASISTPALPPVATPRTLSVPTPSPVAPEVSSALARWNSLRQTDGLPFSSYASFLTRYRDWPGETAMRKTAERAINPDTTSPGEILSYFRQLPPLTPVGHARHALALAAQGDQTNAREAARKAWHGGALPRADEERLFGSFGSALFQTDHDQRMEKLLANRDTVSAARLLPLTSANKQPVFSTRLAMLTKSPDAAARLGALGPIASSDAGVLMDRARWLRDGGQIAAARALMAQPRQLSAPPAEPETWLETLLVLARGAAADRNHAQAFQIASQLGDAYPAGTDITDRSVQERDDYTSLAWLAGTLAINQLGRPADAATAFARYSRGGQSTQVLTKGLYWAGRVACTTSLRSKAARLLGQLGSWEDQSLFIRNLAETADDPIERTLTSDLALQIGRPDLGVWTARQARNGGAPFYTRGGYPQVRIPAAQSHLWSLAHGIIRQESSFDRAAVSHAGARGMMQLMLPTAREQAGKMGMPYDPSRLTRDAEYNIMLGSAYFERLMNQWGGYAPLAIASYNAGAGNVNKWVREYGDPRTPSVDIIAWIETIPFSETRGYVQRVLENAVVYDTLNPSGARTPPTTRLSGYLGKSGQPG